MNDYAKALLLKELEQKRSSIEDCDWWIRTVKALQEEGLTRLSDPSSPLAPDRKEQEKIGEEIEACKQRLRSFQETKEQLESEANDLRSALKRLRS